MTNKEKEFYDLITELEFCLYESGTAYNGYQENYNCPYCHMSEKEGHSDNCKIKKVLDDYKKPIEQEYREKLIPRCCKECFKYDSDECSIIPICSFTPALVCCKSCRNMVCSDFVHESITD